MLAKEYQYIKEEILKYVKSDFSGKIEIAEFDGINVKFDGTNAVIGCGSKVQFARGVFLLAQNYKNGEFEITQKPNFKMLINQLDVARNGVFTMDAIKRWITGSAALGFTHFNLFMVDSYELEGYPRFGYMRGRYSKEELKEIGRICESFGIEVIPLVQCLNDFYNYLMWREGARLKNTDCTLLIDYPETYKLIEAMISHMRECFPNSKNINIMCDEARDMNKARHEELYGPEPIMDVYLRHVNRVIDIAKKYNFEVTMSGDVLYASKNARFDRYDTETVIKPGDGDVLPDDVTLIYYRYATDDIDYYLNVIKRYQNFGKKLELGGAIWTWEGYTEDINHSFKHSLAFPKAAIMTGNDRFGAYTFGDHGCETNFMHSIGSMAGFAEVCYRGLECTEEDVAASSEFLTKIPLQARLDMGKVYSDYHDGYRLPKAHMCGDIFYNLVNKNFDYDKVRADMLFAEAAGKKYMDLHDDNYEYYKLHYYCIKLSRIKLEVMHDIRPAYKNGDKEYLRLVAEKLMPEFVNDMQIYMETFKKDWLRDKKAFGIESAYLRLAAAKEQAMFRIEQLNGYLNGDTDRLEELEQEVIVDPGMSYAAPRCFTASRYSIGF